MLDYTTEQLEELPTLCEGQADDLKVDDGDVRYWLSRCGLVDGEPWQNTVTIEARSNGCWSDAVRYDGDDPNDFVIVASSSAWRRFDSEDLAAWCEENE